MKKIEFEIPIFDIGVILIQVEKDTDKEKVLEILEAVDATQEILDEVGTSIENNNTDGASTFWNGGLHTAVIVFYMMETEKRKTVCYSHEKRHLEDRILKFCGIDDVETAGYLSGYLAPIFKDLYYRDEHISLK